MNKEQKRHYQQEIKCRANNLGIGDMFSMINQGATVAEIELFIDKMELDYLATRAIPVEYDTESDFTVFGSSLISQNAVDDMSQIMRLPYVTGGALMPDAHRTSEGSVPVGGVVVSDFLLPEVVGNDISCSMGFSCMSDHLDEFSTKELKDAIKEVTRFGYEQTRDQDSGRAWYWGMDDQIGNQLRSDLGKRLWKNLYNTIVMQFATSGSGNHFVEIGEYIGNDSFYGLGIASHFGSRKFGAVVAKEFTQFAYEQNDMPKGVKAAPLRGDMEAHDYWLLMQACGDYAETGHYYVHKTIQQHLGLDLVEWHYNRHNYAWLLDDGRFVHRKGATPAGIDTLGFIPATMAHPSALVRGLGNPNSWNSASHGAGRVMSRGQAKAELAKVLKGRTDQEYINEEYGIELIGAGLDEFPAAYKDLKEVMTHQKDCVEVLGWFTPKVVRMAEPEERKWKR